MTAAPCLIAARSWLRAQPSGRGAVEEEIGLGRAGVR
jgi:hypothetical protein